MPLTFAAIVPHPPVLIPNIGKENIIKLEATKKSFQLLEEDLYQTQPDTILIISPHGSIQPDVFTMNLSPDFEGNFEMFGDFATKIHFEGDLGLAYKIRERMETRAPLQLISDFYLDHGCTVPLYFLTKHLAKPVKIIPLYYSGLDLEKHFKFGHLLKRELGFNNDKIAVIASGDLSHRITEDAPAGYSPKGKKFDQKLIEYLSAKKNHDILTMNHHFIEDAGECGLKSIVILLGILEGTTYEPQKLSYEAPFGVGYLVMKYKL